MASASRPELSVAPPPTAENFKVPPPPDVPYRPKQHKRTPTPVIVEASAFELDPDDSQKHRRTVQAQKAAERLKHYRVDPNDFNIKNYLEGSLHGRRGAPTFDYDHTANNFRLTKRQFLQLYASGSNLFNLAFRNTGFSHSGNQTVVVENHYNAGARAMLLGIADGSHDGRISLHTMGYEWRVGHDMTVQPFLAKALLGLEPHDLARLIDEDNSGVFDVAKVAQQLQKDPEGFFKENPRTRDRLISRLERRILQAPNIVTLANASQVVTTSLGAYFTNPTQMTDAQWDVATRLPKHMFKVDKLKHPSFAEVAGKERVAHTTRAYGLVDDKQLSVDSASEASRAIKLHVAESAKETTWAITPDEVQKELREGSATNKYRRLSEALDELRSRPEGKGRESIVTISADKVKPIKPVFVSASDMHTMRQPSSIYWDQYINRRLIETPRQIAGYTVDGARYHEYVTASQQLAAADVSAEVKAKAKATVRGYGLFRGLASGAEMMLAMGLAKYLGSNQTPDYGEIATDTAVYTALGIAGAAFLGTNSFSRGLVANFLIPTVSEIILSLLHDREITAGSLVLNALWGAVFAVSMSSMQLVLMTKVLVPKLGLKIMKLMESYYRHGNKSVLSSFKRWFYQHHAVRTVGFTANLSMSTGLFYMAEKWNSSDRAASAKAVSDKTFDLVFDEITSQNKKSLTPEEVMALVAMDAPDTEAKWYIQTQRRINAANREITQQGWQEEDEVFDKGYWIDNVRLEQLTESKTERDQHIMKNQQEVKKAGRGLLTGFVKAVSNDPTYLTSWASDNLKPSHPKTHLKPKLANKRGYERVYGLAHLLAQKQQDGSGNQDVQDILKQCPEDALGPHFPFALTTIKRLSGGTISPEWQEHVIQICHSR